MSRNQQDTLADKRSFPRVSKSCVVRYRRLDSMPAVEEQDATSQAVMNNISGGGMSFASPESMEEGSMVAMEIELPQFPMAVIAMGKVVWCQDAAEGPGCDLGVEFWWIGWKDQGAQDQIRSIISDALSS